MASSVVRDDSVRECFKDGIFWIPVGREGKDVALLLEHLAIEMARVSADKPHRARTDSTAPKRLSGTCLPFAQTMT